MENAIKDDGWTRMEWQRDEGEGRGTYVNTRCWGKHFCWSGSLSETAYTVADKVKKTSPTSRNDVWRQFYCAFHSVGRFEIQARILLCPKRGTEGQAAGLQEGRCIGAQEDYER